MNLVKASTILYPILGENVSDIVLGYMSVIHYENANNDKFKVNEDRVNLHNFCNQRYLNNYNLGIFVTDFIFEILNNIWKENRDCNRLRIQGKNCIGHNIDGNPFYCYLPEINLYPIYSDHYSPDHYEQYELYEQYCLDIGVKYFNPYYA